MFLPAGMRLISTLADLSVLSVALLGFLSSAAFGGSFNVGTTTDLRGSTEQGMEQMELYS